MSKITTAINQVKSFSQTPAGKVSTTGISYMLSMALSGAILARFFPDKATFGRALGLGLYAVGMQTLVGSAMTAEQQQRNKWAEESFENYRNNTREKLTHLHSEILELQNHLAKAEKDLIRSEGIHSELLKENAKL